MMEPTAAEGDGEQGGGEAPAEDSEERHQTRQRG
jgi:hypothetical protein